MAKPRNTTRIRRFRSDQDSAWKEAITDFFPEFIEYFFPNIHADIDWRRGWQFLDKELARIGRGHRRGRRVADKLVQVWLNDGTETWLLIHIEIQGRFETGLERRLYVYNYRLSDRFEREIVSLVVLTGASGRTGKSGKYETRRWGCRTLFEFPIVRISDYKSRWQELETSRNPFAVVVMAQLKALEARDDETRRLEWKRRLIFMLYERGFQREQIINLFKFIDWILVLPDDLEQPLLDEVVEHEEGKIMPYVTSAEYFGHLRGLQQGRQEEAQTLVLRLLTHRFGKLSRGVQAKVKALSVENTEALAEALLDFETLQELKDWLSEHAEKTIIQ